MIGASCDFGLWDEFCLVCDPPNRKPNQFLFLFYSNLLIILCRYWGNSLSLKLWILTDHHQQMGSEGSPAAVTTVYVTGFKKFHGVSENPTETIVNNLMEYLKKGLPKGLVIGSCNILETAGQGAVVPLYQSLQSSITSKESESPTSNRIIWVSSPIYSLCRFSVYARLLILMKFLIIISDQDWDISLGN